MGSVYFLMLLALVIFARLLNCTEEISLLSAEGNIVKVCKSATTNPASCAPCNLVGDAKLGAFNDYACNDAQGTTVYLTNDASIGHFVQACEVEVMGSQA